MRRNWMHGHPAAGAVIHGIQFDFDSAVIRPESGLIIDSLSAGLRDTAASDRIVIIGHTSSEGSETYNEQLSHRRAAAVVDALIARGIDAGRVSAEGLGEQQPIAANETEAGTFAESPGRNRLPLTVARSAQTRTV